MHEVEGQHLWAVTVDEIEDETLWITTKQVSVWEAIVNAHTFMRTQGHDTTDSTITEVVYRGTIDI